MPAHSAATLSPLSVTGCPGRGRSCPMAAAATSGHVPPTSKPLNSVDKVLLLSRREILAADLRQARRLHRPTSSITAELRRITLLTLTF